MKKHFKLILSLILLVTLAACGTKKPEVEDDHEKEVYKILAEAEEISGLTSFNSRLITENGSLGLPTEYNGVTFSYSSRSKDIISDDGVVTQPMTWWLQSRNQQGEVVDKFTDLNKNWPVVIDVVMKYENQVRNAKILILVAPHKDAVAPEYKG